MADFYIGDDDGRRKVGMEAVPDRECGSAREGYEIAGGEVSL
jgi:hypothetical protein